MKNTISTATAISALWLIASASMGAEPLSPLANPSLYEERGIATHIDATAGAITIGGKRYRVNARTAVFIDDGRGNARRALKISDIPANASVSFSTAADGSVTQIHVGGSGIQPYRP